MSNSPKGILNLEVKFKGSSLNLPDLTRSHSIGYLKSLIYEQTLVSPENQKLLGLKTLPGVKLDDSLTFDEVILPSNNKILMMGSTSDQIKNINVKNDVKHNIVDDLDCKEIDVEVSLRPEYIAKICRRVKDYKLTVLNQPRLGSKLLVLDIDYTIFDHRSVAQTVRELMRPFLHEFLCKVYPIYDIAIWSATGMGWIRTKLCEMGLISRAVSQSIHYSDGQPPSESENNDVETTSVIESSDSFKISLILDQGAMISIHFPDEGVKEVKPLKVIWENYPQWGPHNTIMFDDIQRNFAMNPQSGLKIRPYKHSARTRDTDKELLDLSAYLLSIGSSSDFGYLDHKNWRRHIDRGDHDSKRAKFEK